MFLKKVITDSCNPILTQTDTTDCLSDTTEVILKLIRVKFKQSPGNINIQQFYWGELNFVICSRPVESSTFVQRGFRGQNFTRKLSGVGSIGTLRFRVLIIT